MLEWKIIAPDPHSFELIAIKGLLIRHFSIPAVGICDDTILPPNVQLVYQPVDEIIVECTQTIGTGDTMSTNKWTANSYQQLSDLIDANGWRTK